MKDNNYILDKLHEPYWGAYQRYGWEQGVFGIGIACEVVNKAMDNRYGVVVEIEKYGTYRINPNKLEKYHNQKYIYVANDKKFLYVYPKTEFEKYEITL